MAIKSIPAIVLLLCLTTLSSAIAQSDTDIDDTKAEIRDPDRRVPDMQLFSMKYSIIPDAKFTDPENEAEEEARLTTHNFDASVMLPMVYNNDETILLHSFGYNGLNLVYENWETNRADEWFHGFSYLPGIVQKLKKKWSFLMMAGGGYYSDLKKAQLKAINIDSVVMLMYEHNPDFMVGFGLAYGSNFGEPLPMPALQTHWYMGAGFSLTAFLPQSAAFHYVPHNRLILTLHLFESAGASYRGSVEDVEGEYADPSTGQVKTIKSDGDFILAYSVISAGPEVKVRLVSNLYLTAYGKVGTRRFDILDQSFENENFGEDVKIQSKDEHMNFSNFGDDYTWIAGGGLEIGI